MTVICKTPQVLNRSPFWIDPVPNAHPRDPDDLPILEAQRILQGYFLRSCRNRPARPEPGIEQQAIDGISSESEIRADQMAARIEKNPFLQSVVDATKSDSE